MDTTVRQFGLCAYRGFTANRLHCFLHRHLLRCYWFCTNLPVHAYLRHCWSGYCAVTMQFYATAAHAQTIFAFCCHYSWSFISCWSRHLPATDLMPLFCCGLHTVPATCYSGDVKAGTAVPPAASPSLFLSLSCLSFFPLLLLSSLTLCPFALWDAQEENTPSIQDTY